MFQADRFFSLLLPVFCQLYHLFSQDFILLFSGDYFVLKRYHSIKSAMEIGERQQA